MDSELWPGNFSLPILGHVDSIIASLRRTTIVNQCVDRAISGTSNFFLGSFSICLLPRSPTCLPPMLKFMYPKPLLQRSVFRHGLHVTQIRIMSLQQRLHVAHAVTEQQPITRPRQRGRFPLRKFRQLIPLSLEAMFMTSRQMLQVLCL